MSGFPQITHRAELPFDYLDLDLPIDKIGLNVINSNPYTSIIFGLAKSIGGTLLQTYLNDRATKRNQEYNNPSAQVERLKMAGINPMAALGQVASNNTLAHKPADVNNLSPAEFLQLQNAHLQNMNLKEQNKSISLDNELKRRSIYYRDATFESKVASQFYKMNRERLQAMLTNETISRAEYQTAMAANDAAYSDWLNSPNSFTDGLSPRQYLQIQNGALQHFRSSIANTQSQRDDYYLQLLKEFGIDNSTQTNNVYSLFMTMLKMLMNMDADIPSNYTAPFSK